MKKKKGKQKASIFSHIIPWFWKIFFGLFLFLFLFIASIRYNLFGLFGPLPGYASIENPQDGNDLSSELISADGKVLGKYYLYNRSLISYEDISPNLEKTLLATEDLRFYDHSGIDFRSTLRVIFKTVLMGRSESGGGSTISQQLAKNLFRTREDELQGHLAKLKIAKLNQGIFKIKEWITAIQLERAFTKKEIMAMYLNTIFFGEESYGIKSASKVFFSTTPDKLNYRQSAMLVGMLNKPSRYNPIRHPEQALKKRQEVLYNLVQWDFISQEAYDSIKVLPLETKPQREAHNEGMAQYFRSVIKPFLTEWCKENDYNLYDSGLKIYTTIDSRLQQKAEEAMQEHMGQLQTTFDAHWGNKNPWIDKSGSEVKDYALNILKRTPRYKALEKKYGKGNDSIMIVLNTPVPTTVFTWEGDKELMLSPLDSVRHFKRFLQSGFVAMDPEDGQVKAWVGGIDFKYFQFDHVQQGARQPGSTFKPFVYCAAIDNGYSPCYTVSDAPTTINMKGFEPYTPMNYNKTWSYEKMTLRQGMAQSKNSVVAFLTEKITADNAIDYAKRLGITTPIEKVPSVALGVSDAKLIEMVAAYAAFVNAGTWSKPYYITRIEDKYGNVIQEFTTTKKVVLSEESAYLMTYMLRGATEEKGGTAMGMSAAVREDNEVGGKTGTTQDGTDGWFIGITRNLVAGCWVGGDDAYIRFRTTSLGNGARMALPMWDKFFQKVYADPKLGYQKMPFKRPSRPLSMEINCDEYHTPIDTTEVSDFDAQLDPDKIN